MFESFLSKKGVKKQFTAKEMIEALGKKKTPAIKDLLVFLEVIGYLKIVNLKLVPVENRKYELPIMFRKVYRRKN